MPAKGDRKFCKAVSVYLDVSTLEWIDAFSERLKRENPGMVCKRCDAVRMMLARLMVIDQQAVGDKPVSRPAATRK